MGRDLAIDASDLPAYANGQRFVSKGGRERSDDEFSDPDASWGHRSAVSTCRGGGFYGYKVDMATCSRTGLPVAWQVRSARANESTFAAPLLDAASAHGFAPETCALDKGYDLGSIYAACEDRGVRPIIPLRATPDVRAGKADPPTCEHGTWTFAGPTPRAERPSGAARPASASPAPGGSRPTGCIRWSRARRSAGSRSTGDAPLSSENSAGSRMSGRCCRSACAGSSGFGSMPI
jgi:hypothetical protein